MRIQIAICTLNRARLLEHTLKRLMVVRVPESVQLEVLLVDNGSSDQTSRVIEQFSQDLPIVSIVERQVGHCFARNRAISAADGDLLIWTDDDVLPHEEWLARYVKAIKRHPSATFLGGPIVPKFELPPPAWIQQNWETCKGCFAARDLGPREFKLDKSSLPYGANFAVRTRVQKEFLFDTSLGRSGSSVSGDDELEMLGRMIDQGHEGYWVPKASLQHLIPPERATERYVESYFIGQGERVAARGKATESPAGLFREMITQRALYLVKRPVTASPTWMAHLARAALAKGKRKWLRRS